MTRATKRAPSVVGVSDHGGWAVLVTVGLEGTLVDRRRVALIEPGLPALPHHCEGQRLPLPQAVELVGRVRASAARSARASLELLAAEVAPPIIGIALRACPALPETIEERLTGYRARNVADWVMYRQTLAEAAAARGWSVHWFDSRRVFAQAAVALGRRSIDDLLDRTGAALGPPWQKDQKLAMAAAIAAGGTRTAGGGPR